MQLKALVGEGSRIMGLALPFAALGIAANVLWPSVFGLGLPRGAVAVGIALLAIGVPVWITSAALILINVPRGRLITSGPYAMVLHPLYTSVALLVIPGCGLLLGTWLGLAIGAALYASSRMLSGREEEQMRSSFPQEYPEYRKKVMLPWL